ncbi:MAG: serine/threonine-protein kinase [bacterium]
MSDERWQRLQELFDRAQGMSLEERRTLLERDLADDPALRAELVALLAADESAVEFLVSRESKGDLGSIGPYRLVETLGEGGFGVVYLAEQTRPIRRRVALKLIKPGMDTKQTVARFEAERQALALMDHPGIAQVLEAGETEAGRPYFVMEYVPGEPITSFCDRERLDVRDRLALFADVCDAVQHAHQRGVIHRDLKPSNVIVARRERGVASKVIDFGIAKATTPTGAEQTAPWTQEGVVLGTLAYMSPEQAGMAPGAVDTRTDVYALGAMLHELLTGAPPFDPDRLRAMPTSEALRVIREEDPPPMVTRTSREPEILAETAARRSTDPRRLLRDLRSDVRWITTCALEKDPDRRYASAGELATDVRRFLAGEPLAAAAPSTVYRLDKLVRRHRAAVAAATVVLLAVLVGSIVAAMGFRRGERVARREAETASQVSDFLVDLFQSTTPQHTQGENVTARELLEQGTRRIEASGPGDPRVRARLLTSLGEAHLNLGLTDEGVRLLRAALATVDSIKPKEDRAVAEQTLRLASGLTQAGKDDVAQPLFGRLEAMLPALGHGDSDFLERYLTEKGVWLMQHGDYAPADSLISRALGVVEAKTPIDNSQLPRLLATKAMIALRRSDCATAEKCYLRMLRIAEQTARPMSAAGAHRGLSWVYAAMNEPEKAVRHAKEAVDLARKLYGPDHFMYADALAAWAAALGAGGEVKQAIDVDEEAVGIFRARDMPTALAHELKNVGVYCLQAEDFARARDCFQESYVIWERTVGPDNVRTAEALSLLAYCWDALGSEARADSLYRKAIPVFEHREPRGVRLGDAYKGHGTVCRRLRRFEQADALYSRGEAAMDSSHAPSRLHYADCLGDHGYLRSLQGRHVEAESMLSTSMVLMFGDAPKDSKELGDALVRWAAARVNAGDPDGAIEKLRRAQRCGATPATVAGYPELAPLRARAGYSRETAP